MEARLTLRILEEKSFQIFTKYVRKLKARQKQFGVGLPLLMSDQVIDNPEQNCYKRI